MNIRRRFAALALVLWLACATWAADGDVYAVHAPLPHRHSQQYRWPAHAHVSGAPMAVMQ